MSKFVLRAKLCAAGNILEAKPGTQERVRTAEALLALQEATEDKLMRLLRPWPVYINLHVQSSNASEEAYIHVAAGTSFGLHQSLRNPCETCYHHAEGHGIGKDIACPGSRHLTPVKS